MTTSLSDAVAQTERALLGSILLDNSLWSETEAVSVDDFSLESHRRIYRCMASMAEDRCPIDEVTLPHELQKRNELESIGGFAYIGALLDDVVPENIATYVNSVRQASTERRLSRQVELITKTCEMPTPGMRTISANKHSSYLICWTTRRRIVGSRSFIPTKRL